MAVTVERFRSMGRDRIKLTGWAGSDTPALCKSVPGASPNRDKATGKFGFWSYPLNMTTCRLLREAFGDDLKIGPELASWARNAIQEEAALATFHSSVSAVTADLRAIPAQAPTIWGAMQNRGYQSHVPVFAERVGGPHANGDQPGTGKTIEELGTLVELGIRGFVLVLAPAKALRATWAHEINKWILPDFPDAEITVSDSEEGSTADREKLLIDRLWFRPVHSFHFVLCNPEMVRIKPVCPSGQCRGNKWDCYGKDEHTQEILHPILHEIAWDGILLDESHKYMMNANERSASVSQVGLGIQKLKSAKREAGHPYRVVMSGTPFKGKPRRFWPVLHWLRPDTYTGQNRWAKVYFETIADSWAQSGEKVTDTMRPERVADFNREMDSIMIRRTKRELRTLNPAWAPPDKQHVDITLTMTAAQRRAYLSIVKSAEADLDGGILTATGILAEMTRMKQFASASGKMVNGVFVPTLPSCKWDWIKNVFMAERGMLDEDGSSKAVVASQFTSILAVYAAELDKLKIPYVTITGKSKNVARIQQEWQAEYKAGDPRICLLGTAAGGVSLTLDAADDLVVNDEMHGDPDAQEQVEDRVHRTSRTDHQVTIYHLTTAGTLEETIRDSNWEADFIQKQILDARRGVQFARQVLLGA